MVRAKNTVNTNNNFQWETIPESDINRLAKNLQSRARADDKLALAIDECREHTKLILSNQKYTCLLAGGDSKYCWNEPRDKSPYLRLQWSHKIPIPHNPSKTIKNFVLLCARCNNQIQSSRTLAQLCSELEHKTAVLNLILSNESSE